MKRIIASWQGLMAGIIALVLYLFLPTIIRWYDPTAGTFDAGYLQWYGLAVVLYFGSIFFAWVGFQIAFPSIDKAADKGISKWFNEMSPSSRWWATQVAFFLMLLVFLICLVLVPL